MQRLVCDRCKVMQRLEGDSGGWERIEEVPGTLLERGRNCQAEEEKLSKAKASGGAQDLCPNCADAFVRYWESPEKPKTAQQRAAASYRARNREKLREDSHNRRRQRLLMK